MKLIKTHIILILLVTPMLSGCLREKFSLELAADQYRECLGKENYALLEKLAFQFEQFLSDNHYVREGNMLEGYKGYLQHLLDRKGLDTSWHYRLDELEALLLEFEHHHLAEVIYEEKVSQCAIEIDYPQHYIMARYREIMPQHTVSPEVFMRTFIQKADEKQFRDQVLKSMVALEYFLGNVLYLLRPDELYFQEDTPES
jgi:hypothetical protein